VAKETKKFNSDPHFIRVKIKMRPTLAFFLNYIGITYGTFCLINQTLHFEIKQKYRDTKESEVNLPKSLQFVSTFSKERAASNGSIEGRTQLSKTLEEEGTSSATRSIDIMASHPNRFRNFPENRTKTKEKKI
jgi:alpha-mannosidase